MRLILPSQGRDAFVADDAETMDGTEETGVPKARTGTRCQASSQRPCGYASEWFLLLREHCVCPTLGPEELEVKNVGEHWFAIFAGTPV